MTMEFGAWMHSGSPLVANLLATTTGIDYVVVDLQHGTAREADLPLLCTLIAGHGRLPLVRARSQARGDIGRPLDLGAQGIIVPNVEGFAQAQRAIAASKYPPDGGRSEGQFFTATSDARCIVMVESAGAISELDRILELEHLDGIYVGPADLQRSVRALDEHADIQVVIEHVVERCVAAGVPVGVHATSGSDAARWNGLGCSLVTVTSDLAALQTGAQIASLKARDRAATDDVQESR